MKLSEKYTIRLANIEDIPDIMEFINVWWRKDHIIAIDREYLQYEFLEENGQLNFVIAVDNDTKEIKGLEGFLKTAKTGEFDLWTSFWKVTDDALPLLGVEIRKKIDVLTGCRYSFGIGDNPKTTVPLMKRVFRRNCYKMQHFYMLGECDKYEIAVVNHPQTSRTNELCDYSIREIKDKSDFTDFWNVVYDSKWIPCKDAKYYTDRFFDNPIYKYNMFGVFDAETPVSFFITREQKCGDKSVIRIVDYYGNDNGIVAMGGFIKSMIVEKSIEYADFYCFGYNEEKLIEAGFDVLAEEDSNIIPNYFYPFVQSNIDIWLDSPVEGAKFSKGDSDQDRPSVRE